MTIGRVTHQTVQRSTLANLQANLQRSAELQARMSAGTKITVPSDDPAGAADLLRLRADQRANVQHQRNATDGDAWLTTVDSALQESLAIVRKARDLAVRAGSGAMGAESREALAAEMEALGVQLRGQANTQYAGRSVFAGTASGPAFGPAPAYAHGGATGAAVTRQVGPETAVRVDSDGAAVFGTGAGSAFALLDDLAATIRAGGDLSAGIDGIDARMSAMLREVASVGARHNQVKSATAGLADEKVTLASQLSAIEDVDLAQAVLDLQAQEVAYQGALAATAKVLQPTLLDFLR
ncbi:flagellin N-terminal helical domain-containing protein [Cellulomonas telluris]|uniref:flagellin N-terminal helical domain-containing protein n=1 Tax=Cellulomonas telluris TaxID=2306636 RepID=UPI0010A78E07|nr:flagellin [Cellulomonas telluris]